MTATYPPGTFPGLPPTPPTQYPAAPSYPAGPGQLPPQYYPPQQFPQYAPGYPPAAAVAPAQPLAQGSIDDFYSQPSTGGGKSISFPNQQYGTRHVGVVTRPITGGDIQQQTDTLGRPQTFRDGRPKFVMKVPLQMQPSAAHPDGLGVLYVKGQMRDELVRAMAEAGAPSGPPEANAVIDITYVADRQSGAGMNPAKQFHIVYTRPDGQTSSPTPQAAAQLQVQPQPQGYNPPPPNVDPAQYQQSAQYQQAAQYPQQYAQPVPPQQVPVQQPPAPAAPVAAAAPADLSPDQQALLARLTGASQG